MCLYIENRYFGQKSKQAFSNKNLLRKQQVKMFMPNATRDSTIQSVLLESNEQFAQQQCPFVLVS